MNKTDIKRIWLSDNAIWIELLDGRTACELFDDYETLARAPLAIRQKYKISFYGIHWPELDEDLSFAGFFKSSVAK